MIEKRYAALHEFHSGTPAKRPYFDDWRYMLSCARFLAQWFTVAEERGESIGLLDEKKLKFGVDDGRVQYDGCDVTQLSGVKIGKIWSELLMLKKEEMTWSVTQFLPPDLMEKILSQKADEAENSGNQEYAACENSDRPAFALERYQLPVLLFKLFFGCHPICWNDEIPGGVNEWLEILKSEGAFRFSEGKTLPEPFLYPYASARWNVFPDWFKEACTFTFTEAVRDPERLHPVRSWLDMINTLCDTYTREKNDETKKYRHPVAPREIKVLESGMVILLDPYFGKIR